MKNEGKAALAYLTASAEKEFCAFLAQQTPELYEDAVALIEECRAAGHRVHVTGIGKPGHVAAYAASLLSSTGTPSYFLHGTDPAASLRKATLSSPSPTPARRWSSRLRCSL